MTHSPRPNQQGVAAVEFGILLFLLVSLAFGITEFGRAIYQYNSIAKGVRDGVRLLSQAVAGDATQIAAAKCLVVFGNTACSGSALVTGLTIGMVSVSDASTSSSQKGQSVSGLGTVDLVTVSVSGFQFQSMMTLVVPNITFNSISATMIQS